ncbi:MAG: DUF1499 domain-containing protein [Thiohalomonadales bacterium]
MLNYIIIILIFVIVTVFIIQFIGLLKGERPEILGIHNNQLRACPEKSNCVSSYSSYSSNLKFNIEPLPYFSTAENSITKIQKTLLGIKGITIITQDKDYIYAECKSFFLGFVDDLEVYCDESKQRCFVRSASRLGYSDFGVNRKRIEKIRKLIQK